MTRTVLRLPAAAAAVILPLILSSCGDRVPESYDTLAGSNDLEGTVRKEYPGYFKRIAELETADSPDSALVSRVSAATDEVIAVMRPFPETVESRLALDALSFAAADLGASPAFEKDVVAAFWRGALLDPILTKSTTFISRDDRNISTHLQLVRALQRAIGSHGTNDLVTYAIDLVGPAPSDTVLAVCRDDSLVFRKAFDLVIFSQSRQEVGPPIWMVTGPWLLVFDTVGEPLIFVALRTELIDNILYLTFRDYTQGEVYAAIFDDPVPEGSDKLDAWLLRAGGVMQSLKMDDTFAARVKKCNLPVHDTHYYYHDYLLSAQADTLARQYKMTLKTDRIDLSTFEFSGEDSLRAVFNEDEVRFAPEVMYALSAERIQGGSMSGGRYRPSSRTAGTAYLMPMGLHDQGILDDLLRRIMPDIKVNS